jgi:hypothetical protein
MSPLAGDPDMPGLLSPDSDSDSDGALSPTLPDLFGRPTPDVEAATEDARSDATLSPQRPGPWALFGRMGAEEVTETKEGDGVLGAEEATEAEEGDGAMKFPPTRILVPSDNFRLRMYVRTIFVCVPARAHARALLDRYLSPCRSLSEEVFKANARIHKFKPITGPTPDTAQLQFLGNIIRIRQDIIRIRQNLKARKGRKGWKRQSYMNVTRKP